MAATGDVAVAEGGKGSTNIHPYLITLVRWCVSCLWSTATVLLHRLTRAQVPRIAAPKTVRAASNDHLHPEPKVECVVLHEPAAPTLDVIFVHGLYGSLGNTWRQGDWRTKYKIDPNVVHLRNHPSKQSCICHTLQHNIELKRTNTDNRNKCKINNDKPNYNFSINERENTYKNVNERENSYEKVNEVYSTFENLIERENTNENLNEKVKKVLPNESSLITENFYNNTLLNNESVCINYRTQAMFVQDLFDKSKICDNNVKCNNSDSKCKDLNECVCKVNERKCYVGCGCVCESCYSTCWPKDWIKMDFPGARVISINYTSDPYLWRPLWVKGNTRLRLHERADQMISQLLELGVGERPIIWVGHSKGGLFIKQIYCEAFDAHSRLCKIKHKNVGNNNHCKTNPFIHIKDINPTKNKSIPNNNGEKSEDFNEGFLLKIHNLNENHYTIDFAKHMDNIRIPNEYILERNHEIFDILKSGDINKSSFNRAPDFLNNDSDGYNKTKNGNNREEFKVYNLNKTAERNLLLEDNRIKGDVIPSKEEIRLLKIKASLWRYSAGFMFYSVPHRGSPLAAIKTPITTRSIELLEISKDCPLVLSLHERWLEASCQMKPVVCSLVETCRTLMSVLWLRIVSVDSADAGIGDLCGVSVDHREICKPSSRSCLLYTQLTDLITAALNKCQCTL